LQPLVDTTVFQPTVKVIVKASAKCEDIAVDIVRQRDTNRPDESSENLAKRASDTYVIDLRCALMVRHGQDELDDKISVP
jgi:hypothetical protein